MEDLMEVACRGARDVAESFTDPDEDWNPMIFLRGRPGVIVCDVSSLMASEETKRALVERVIPELVSTYEATEAAMLVSVWGVEREGDPNEAQQGPPPSEDPERMEMVIAFSVASDGSDRHLVAFIDRDPLGLRPPKLGEFEEQENAIFAGRFVEAFAKAMRTT